MNHNKKCKSSVVLILAGGTGGHIFPALAVADELKRRGYTIHWVGASCGMETKIVPQHGYDITTVPVRGVLGNGIKAILQAPVRIAISIYKIIQLIKKLPVSGVIGMGGFITGPGAIAAYIMRRPLIIHEQNAVAGFTNKFVSIFATRILTAFPNVFKDREKKTFLTGNPTRTSISNTVRDAPLHQPMRLLVLGGSRGALAINRCIPLVLKRMNSELTIWHQTGDLHYKTVEEDYIDRGLVAKVEPFIHDMGKAYAWADIVLCRSGALTVAELANAAKPSILVPYPWHKDQQQLLNANYLVNNGAAFLLEQYNLNPGRIVKLLKDLISDPNRLLAMEQAARSLAKPEATSIVVDLCQEVLHEF